MPEAPLPINSVRYGVIRSSIAVVLTLKFLVHLPNKLYRCEAEDSALWETALETRDHDLRR